MNEIYEHISNFIRSKREELDLTQDELAKKSKVSKATLWKIENFVSKPSSEDDFNISLSSLNNILVFGLNSSLFELFAKPKDKSSSLLDKIKTYEITDKSKNEILKIILK